jgi:hypothetical protein
MLYGDVCMRSPAPDSNDTWLGSGEVPPAWTYLEWGMQNSDNANSGLQSVGLEDGCGCWCVNEVPPRFETKSNTMRT